MKILTIRGPESLRTGGPSGKASHPRRSVRDAGPEVPEARGLEGDSAGPAPAALRVAPSRGTRGREKGGGRDGCGAGLRFGVRRRHLLEPALAVLALVPHPARVAEAGGVDTAAREAGAGPLAELGLGHLRVERQVEEAIAQQPAVPVQQPEGGAAATAARRPSFPRPRGRRLRGTSAGPAPRFHLSQRPCPAGMRSRAPTGMLQRGNLAGEENTAPLPPPLLLLTGACSSPAPWSGGTDPRRCRLRSAPSSRTRASPLRLLTLSAAGRAHRHGAPGRAGGGEQEMQAARGAPEGTCGRGRGTQRAAPPRPRLAPTSSAPSPTRPGGRGPREPRGGRAQRGRGD